ncbi:hypothetical protein FXO37_10331 [Capsicum annuum]|nr:hypothetical protein FXO37_10331 [Capsicum annuum]
MATCSVSLNQHGVLIPIQLKEFTLNSRISVPTRVSSNGFPSRITATSAVAVEQELRTPVQDATEDKLFACPICYEPLIRKGPSGFNVPAIYRSGFKCRKCNKSYSSKNLYLDLTVTSGTKEYNESKPTRTELFRSPVVSFLYERGWRQAFNQSGFPGADEESGSKANPKRLGSMSLPRAFEPRFALLRPHQSPLILFNDNIHSCGIF